MAYGATLGGIGTLVGTPPNLAFDRIFKQQFVFAETVGSHDLGTPD